MAVNLVFLLLITGSMAAIVPWSEIKPSTTVSNSSYLDEIRKLWNEFLTYFKATSTLSFKTFSENVVAMLNQNAMFTGNLSSFEMGINEFSAMSENEFAKRLGLNMNVLPSKNRTLTRLVFRGFGKPHNLPKQVDWRKEGYVTEVKDQGSCGSCWAFSAVGALEGAWKRAHGELVDLSEQQLVDCASDFGNFGCEGGLMDNAFEYIKANEGIESEKTYPYVSGVTGAPKQKCFYDHSLAVANLSAIFDIPVKKEKLLMEALANVGPVSIAINAGLRSFMMYKKGIYDDKDCKGEPQDLNHGVLAVGYGVENDIPYWIVKNSWGPRWGEKGFIRIRRGSNLCGVTTMASYPIV